MRLVTEVKVAPPLNAYCTAGEQEVSSEQRQRLTMLRALKHPPL